MSTDGEIIANLFKQSRQVCDQIGLLLRTADEQMLKQGFESKGNNALEGFSYSINSPLQWIPTYVFRFYRNNISAKRLAFISVLIDDDVEKYYSIKEPYVTAGFLDFGTANVSLDGNYWVAKYFGYLLKNPNILADGTIHEFKNDDNDSKVKFQKGKVFALPLTSIKNPDDVYNQLVSKLADIMNKDSNVPK